MRARGKEVYCWLHMLSVKDRANRLQPASRLLCNIDSLAAATSKISRASFRSCTLPAPVVMAPMKAMTGDEGTLGCCSFLAGCCFGPLEDADEGEGLCRDSSNMQNWPLNLILFGWCLVGKFPKRRRQHACEAMKAMKAMKAGCAGDACCVQIWRDAERNYQQ